MSSEYEQNLKEEIFACHKYIGMSFDEIYKMPIRDRKFYIQQHNKLTDEENKEHSGGDKTQTLSGPMLNKYAEMSQSSAR